MLSRILHEDKYVIVAYKPAGLAVQTARVGQSDMASELKNHLRRSGDKDRTSAGRGEPYLGIIHRLDQPVEGILVFGKTKAAAASLTGQLRIQGGEGSFSKQYYAVLCGIPAREAGRLTDCLYKQTVKEGERTDYKAIVIQPDSENQGCSGDRQKPHAAAREAKGGLAVLEYRILQTDGEQGLALADIRIHTGRFHQIRAQMAHAGTPLLGDQKYGSHQTKSLARNLGIRNVALCAYSLGFVHPVSKEEMEFRIRPENPAFSSFHLMEKPVAGRTWNQ